MRRGSPEIVACEARLSRRVRISVPKPDRSVMPPKKTVEKNESGEEAVRLRYSPVEVLRRKDFAGLSHQSSATAIKLLGNLSRLLSHRLRDANRTIKYFTRGSDDGFC